MFEHVLHAGCKEIKGTKAIMGYTLAVAVLRYSQKVDLYFFSCSIAIRYFQQYNPRQFEQIGGDYGAYKDMPATVKRDGLETMSK